MESLKTSIVYFMILPYKKQGDKPR